MRVPRAVAGQTKLRLIRIVAVAVVAVPVAITIAVAIAIGVHVAVHVAVIVHVAVSASCTAATAATIDIGVFITRERSCHLEMLLERRQCFSCKGFQIRISTAVAMLFEIGNGFPVFA